jgi:hypothetical protein
MNSTISRRHFLGTMGTTAVAAGELPRLLAGEPARDNIRLGMMLQGDSAADLQEKAKRIAAVGFQRVQVTNGTVVIVTCFRCNVCVVLGGGRVWVSA